MLALTLPFAFLAQVAPPASPAIAPAHDPPRVVLISGEDECDAEVSLTAFAHLLTERHGMTTSLAASHSPATVHGLEALASADLAILFVHSRTWPQPQSQPLHEFIARGGALVALRTSSGAFAYPADSPLAADSNEFGRRLFGTPWQWDHGPSSSTDVVITPRRRSKDDHDLLRGVAVNFHVRSPLAHVLPLPDDVNVIARGTPVASEYDKEKQDQAPRDNDTGNEKQGAAANGPAPDVNPVAWSRIRPDGGRTFYTSMGHPDDFDVPAFRRLLLDAVLWTLKPPAVPARPITPSPTELDDLDIALPVTKPLTDLEISTAYLSDPAKPLPSQHFPPEEGIAGFNDVQWIKLASPDGSVDLRRFDPTSKQATIYVKTTLHLAAPRELELVLQSDGPLELFVDRKSHFTTQEPRTLQSGCDCIPLKLDPGDHDLMFKSMTDGRAWRVRARVRDLTEYRGGVVRKR